MKFIEPEKKVINDLFHVSIKSIRLAILGLENIEE
jgi:hypothetical protein